MKILRFLGWLAALFTYGLSVYWFLLSILAMIITFIFERLAQLGLAEAIDSQALLWTRIAVLIVFILSAIGLADQAREDRKRGSTDAP
jgi:hypothetical protein